MKNVKKLVALLIAAALLVGTAACAKTAPTQTAKSEVVILYTNDVHCGIDDAIGYAGVSAYKKELEAEGKNVLLVDCGDSIQGAPIGALTKGEAIIKMMNEVGYDVAAFGNHEFDYTVERMLELKKLAAFPYVCCNVTDKNGDLLADPYRIIEAGGWKIAFIGAVTPNTIISSTPAYFQNEAGELIYDFCSGENGAALYAAVQNSVDAARAEGADICVLLAHLGINGEDEPYTSMDVIANTTGIDVVLDAHSHSVMESEHVKNKEGQTVLCSQTGTKLEHIGRLTVSADGALRTDLLSDYEKKDGDFTAFADGIMAAFDEQLSVKVAHSDYDLAITDENGNRIVRNGETNLADLVADAFRFAMHSDVALVNGGGVRVDVPAGDITYREVYSVLPFFNELTVIEATGQQIADALEYGAHAEPEEFGGFLQVSGIAYTVDMQTVPEIETGEDGVMTAIKGARRVQGVLINGEPLDPERTYTVSGSKYLLLGHGDGHSAFDGCRELAHDYTEDAEAFVRYLSQELHGEIPADYADRYGSGRITIVP